MLVKHDQKNRAQCIAKTNMETTTQLAYPWVDNAVLMESTLLQSQYNTNILNSHKSISLKLPNKATRN